MDFTNSPPEWQNSGEEPSQSLKESGFTPGYKPPASFFNWFWSKVSKCISELQTKLSDIEKSKADKQTITGGFSAGRNAKLATVEGTALEYMYIGQWKNGEKLSYVSGNPTGLFDKNNTTPSVSSTAQVFNVFDLGKETNISAITLYVSDHGASTTNMVRLLNELPTSDAAYIEVLRTNGQVQNGVPIIENKLSSDGYIKVGYTDGRYIGKYKYVCVYDWSNICSASELYIETDTMETPIPAIQLGEGKNETPYSFQVYAYTVMDADGHIPPERLNGAFVEKYIFEFEEPEPETEGNPGVLYLAHDQLLGAGASIERDYYTPYFCTAINYDPTEDGGTTYTWKTPRWAGDNLSGNDIYDGSITSAKADFTRYSTTPVQIGKWIDGSPVYRQAFQQEFDGYSVQVFLPNADDYLKVVVLSARCLLRNSTNDTYIWTMYDVGGGGSTSVYIEFAESSKPSGAATAYGYVDYIVES